MVLKWYVYIKLFKKLHLETGISTTVKIDD